MTVCEKFDVDTWCVCDREWDLDFACWCPNVYLNISSVSHYCCHFWEVMWLHWSWSVRLEIIIPISQSCQEPRTRWVCSTPSRLWWVAVNVLGAVLGVTCRGETYGWDPVFRCSVGIEKRTDSSIWVSPFFLWASLWNIGQFVPPMICFGKQFCVFPFILGDPCFLLWCRWPGSFFVKPAVKMIDCFPPKRCFSTLGLLYTFSEWHIAFKKNWWELWAFSLGNGKWQVHTNLASVVSKHLQCRPC